jgi:anti-anti-sigma factor
MKIKIWGARGSIPSPLSAEDLRKKLVRVVQGAAEIDLQDEAAVSDYIDHFPLLQRSTAGGNTSCIELLADETQIIIDAGSGLRNLGNELMKGACGRGEGRIHLFLSHTHWDHIQGFPFFTPAYVPGNQLTIYSVHDVAPTLANQMRSATFPVSLGYMQANIEFQRLLPGNAIQIGDVNVTSMELPHPGKAYAFRFEGQGLVFVYASDAEYKFLDQASLEPYLRFYVGADALIFDAQFSLREAFLKEDWGHSSALIGVDIARQAGVKRLILFHHDPASSDSDLAQMLRQAQQYALEQELETPLEILFGYEGMELELLAANAFNLTMLPGEKIAVLRLVGDLDERVVADLKTNLQELASQPEEERPGLVVDLEATTRLSTAGLRQLVDLRRQWGGETLALTKVSEHVRRVIDLANCLDYFSIYPNLSQALGALDARQTLRLPGQMLKNRYRIEERVGASELGVVLRATDTRLGREVAIKTLSSFSQAASTRFLAQARRMAQLSAPNIVAVFDVDEEKGIVYQIAEYVAQPTLRDTLNYPQSPPWVEIALDILRALEHAHSKGIVHGNLKPENVLLSTPVKLTDFGLRWIEQGQNLMEMPLLLGAPDYLAPEQILGQAVEPRADLYALGVILYEMFTGQRPFTGEATDILEQHLRQPPRPPRELRPELSRPMEHFILKLLAKDPNQRYANATQARRILMRLGQSDPSEIGGDQPTHPHKARRLPMIGRETQLKWLLEQWQLAKKGQGQIVFIAGEAGVGKTRLAEETASQLDQAAVLIGRATESEGRTPYQVFIEAARDYLNQTPTDAWRIEMGETTSVLAAILPELYEAIPGLTPVMPLDAEQERLRLAYQFNQFLQRATRERPWLLILDDLHWADAASLQLLHYLARHIEGTATLILVTYRDVELPPDHALSEMQQKLSRYTHCHRLKLERLDLSEARQLLEGIWRQSIPEEWVQAIYERTGGNPFYIEEVAKNLLDEKAITLQDGVWQFAPLIEVKLPSRVRDIVRQRIARLSPTSREILRLAAVLGQQFAFHDLAAVIEQNESELLESLDELLERGILLEAERSGELTFSHVEFQEVVYNDLKPLRRRLLHQQIGGALETAAKENKESVAPQLAYHFHQAEDDPKCFAYSLQVAKQADQRHAYQTALSWYQDAVSHIDKLPNLSIEDQLTAYEGLGNMLRFHSRYAEAIIVYLTLVELAARSGDTEAHVRALIRLAAAQNNIGDNRTALANATAAEQLARAADAPLQLVHALYYKGWVSRQLGNPNEAIQIGQEALTISERLAPNAQRETAMSLNLLGVCSNTVGKHKQALAYEETALSLFRELGDQERIAALLNNLGATMLNLADYEKAIPLYEESLSLYRQMGNRRGEVMALSNLGEARLWAGNYTQGLDYVQQALDLADNPGRLTHSIYRYMAEAHLGQGDLPQGLEFARRSMTIAEETEEQEFIGRLWRVFGQLAAAWESKEDSLGPPPREIADARVCFQKSERLLAEVGAMTQRAQTLRAWARYELAQGDKTEGERLWQETRRTFVELEIELEVARMDKERGGV